MDTDKVPELVAEAYRLSVLASPGPWLHGVDDEQPDCGIGSANGGCVAHVQYHGNINTVAREGEEFSHDDARFIAASRHLVPKLADAVEALLERVAELEAALKPFAQGHLYADEEYKFDPERDARPLNPYDADRGPTVGDCRRAAQLLAKK